MKRVFIETYGCQMNKADTELVAAVLMPGGYVPSASREDADVILLNTCAVREGAEERVLGVLAQYRRYKETNPALVFGVIGCMAQNLKEQIIEQRPWVDLVVGPDSYRELPALIDALGESDRKPSGRGGSPRPPVVVVRRDRFENYEDISPLRTAGISAWVSIMRGCDNFCTFCIVPHTRGRERSRRLANVIREVTDAVAQGYKEITLLGQNVNSWRDPETGERFAELLSAVGGIKDVKRVRFTSPHPKDFPDAMLFAMRDNPDVLVPHLHLPLQAGNNDVLARMNRGYTKEQYLALAEHIRSILPEVAFSTDIIVGFPGETVEQFEDTLDVIRQVRFSGAFLFKYSPRPYTKAASWKDDVPENEKQRRLQATIDLQREIEVGIVREWVGRMTTILIEGPSPKGDHELIGRIPQNRPVVVSRESGKPGELLPVRITGRRAMTLVGIPDAASKAV